MKRILASFLSVCMLVGMLSFQTWATEAATVDAHTHCACSGVLTGESCASHDTTLTWQAWESTDSLPTVTGHYYLTADVQIKGIEPDMRVSGANDVKLCLNGHNISLAKSNATVSYRISVWEAASKLTIMDCKAQLAENGQLEKGGIISGSSYGTNGAIYARGGELKLIGVEVKDNTNAEKTATYGGGAMQIRNGAKVTVEHAKFTGNTAGSDGGAICIKNGSLLAENTTFAGNTAGISGGAIYLENSSCRAELENCEVTANTAAGAAIYVSGATAVLKETKIADNINNSVSGGGSAVHTAASGKTSLHSCTVTGNKNTNATAYAGAVYLPNSNSSLTVSGSTVIDNNTVGGAAKEANVFLQNAGTKLTLGQLAEGAAIGITTLTAYTLENDPDVFLAKAADITTWDKAWVVYENITASVAYSQEETFYFDTNVAPGHEHCACSGILTGESCESHDMALTWQAWESTDSLPTAAGNYYLTADVQLKGAEPDMRISGTTDVKLCLNGYNISLAKSDANTSYRISVWDAASKLTIMDCKAQLNDKGQLEKGGTISGSSYGTNGAIYARGGELKLIGVEVKDNTNAEKTATYGGGAMQIRNGAKVTVVCAKFTGNTAGSDGGAICIKNGSLLAENTTFAGNTAGISGGAIYLENSSCSAELENCSFDGNTAKGQGGAIYGNIGSKLTGKDLVIMGHNAAGATLHLNGATAKLTASVITKNVNTADGGSALYVANGSTAELTDCTVTDNQNPNRTEYCGGVYVPNNRSKLTISGCTVISGNTVGNAGKEANIFLQNEGTMLTVGQLTAGSSVGITTLKTYTAQEDPDAFLVRAASLTQWDPAWSVHWVKYENNGMNIHHSETEKFYFEVVTDHVHCLCNGTGAAGCDHSQAKWIPWESTGSLPTNSGCYYLTADVELTSAASLKGQADVKLCLNGKTVCVKTQAATDISSVYQLFDSAALTLSDCTATETKSGYVAGKLTGAERSAIWLEAGAAPTLNLYAGILAENHSAVSGGAIRMNGKGTFNMNGGRITDNSGVSAGALYVNDNSVVNLFGGSIQNNTARDNEAKNAGYGGAMLLVRGAQLNLHGGSITGNAAREGGAVYATGDAIVNVLDGTVGANTAEQGGAIGAIENSTVTVSGGTIEGNNAKTGNGGAIFAEKATVRVSGGKISENTAKSGGGLYVGLRASLQMTDGEISKNTSAENGGGIQLFACTADFTGGKVSDNTSKTNGGGIATSQKCQVKLDGIAISGNTAADSGGGVLLQGYDSVLQLVSGTVTKNKAKMGGGLFTSMNTILDMTGGEVSGNEATKSGGGIQLFACTANFTGGKVSGNVSRANGGGICTSEKSQVKLAGTSVTNNTAAEFGGGLLLQGYGSVLDFSSGMVSGNKAKSGGGLFISTNTTLNMTGGEVSGNASAENGGGIQQYVSTGNYSGGIIQNNTAGKNGAGICTSQKSRINLQGTTIRGNRATEAAGGVLLQGYGSVMNFSRGLVENNSALYGGGMYISTNTTLNMTGGTVRNNTAEKDGGGIMQLLSTANYQGGTVENNKATVNGGGLCTTQKCTVNLEGTKIAGNSAVEAGGGVLIKGYGSTLQLTSGQITGNTATLGAGLFGSVNTVLGITGGEIFENAATEDGGGVYLYYSTVTASGCQIHDNTAQLNGGGVFSDHSQVQLSDLTVRNNTANGNGGGIRTGQMDIFTLKNVEIKDNTSEQAGGGLYLGIGSRTVLENVTITGNRATGCGGALYAIDDLSMASLTATDNKSGQGGAVHLDDASFDGRSYFAGLMIMSGDMRIYDNGESPADLYIGQGTALSVGPEGLGENTNIHVKLASGVLTNTVFGAYDYEGGNCEYVITYGDRSLHELEQVPQIAPGEEPQTEPTTEAPDTEEQEPQKNGALWVVLAGVGVVAIVVAILLIILGKKKKSQHDWKDR